MERVSGVSTQETVRPARTHYQTNRGIWRPNIYLTSLARTQGQRPMHVSSEPTESFPASLGFEVVLKKCTVARQRLNAYTKVSDCRISIKFSIPTKAQHYQDPGSPSSTT